MGIAADMRADYEAVVKGQHKATRTRMFFAFFRRKSFKAAVLYRLSHAARKRGWRVLGGLLERRILRSCGCDISSCAEIGPGLCLPHPMGVVIGNSVRIGCRSYILQHVTLGGSLDKRKGDQVQPIVGDDVLIGAGAKLLGPVTIGRGSIIGANSVVLADVPEDAIAVGVPARVIRRSGQRVPLLEQGGELAGLLHETMQRLRALEDRLAALEGQAGPTPAPGPRAN